MRQERLASFGQRDVPFHAVEQRRAKLGLELSDLLTDGWLGHVQLFRRAREVEMPAHRLEIRELVHFHRPRLL